MTVAIPSAAQCMTDLLASDLETGWFLSDQIGDGNNHYNRLIREFMAAPESEYMDAASKLRAWLLRQADFWTQSVAQKLAEDESEPLPRYMPDDPPHTTTIDAQEEDAAHRAEWAAKWRGE